MRAVSPASPSGGAGFVGAERLVFTSIPTPVATEKTYTAEEIAEIVKRNAQLEAENEVAQQIIEEQETRLKEANLQGADSHPVVTHEGEHYRVVLPQFQYGSKVYAAADLKNNQELVAQLVKDESGVLELIVAEESEKK